MRRGKWEDGHDPPRRTFLMLRLLRLGTPSLPWCRRGSGAQNVWRATSPGRSAAGLFLIVNILGGGVGR